MPKFEVRIGSTTLLHVFIVANAAHRAQMRSNHNPQKCKTCEALDRCEEELEMGRLGTM